MLDRRLIEIITDNGKNLDGCSYNDLLENKEIRDHDALGAQLDRLVSEQRLAFNNLIYSIPKSKYTLHDLDEFKEILSKGYMSCPKGCVNFSVSQEVINSAELASDYRLASYNFPFAVRMQYNRCPTCKSETLIPEVSFIEQYFKFKKS